MGRQATAVLPGTRWNQLTVVSHERAALPGARRAGKALTLQGCHSVCVCAC